MGSRIVFLYGFLCGTVIFLAGLGLAHELLKMSYKDYLKLRHKSATPEAYERARKRLSGVELGMRTDQFFEKMEMLLVRDDKGEAIDGFVEGYLQNESIKMTKGKDPDRFLIFGYYTNWKKKKGPVKKFYAVFRHKVLREIIFFDPSEDVLGFSERTSKH